MKPVAMRTLTPVNIKIQVIVITHQGLNRISLLQGPEGQTYHANFEKVSL